MYKTQEEYPSKENKELFQAVLGLENINEAIKFFRDILTIREINDISCRWQIAKLLHQKKLSYEQIARKCRVSTTTVTRVAHWLNRGLGGYKLILSRLSSKKK